MHFTCWERGSVKHVLTSNVTFFDKTDTRQASKVSSELWSLTKFSRLLLLTRLLAEDGKLCRSEFSAYFLRAPSAAMRAASVVRVPLVAVSCDSFPMPPVSSSTLSETAWTKPKNLSFCAGTFFLPMGISLFLPFSGSKTWSTEQSSELQSGIHSKCLLAAWDETIANPQSRQCTYSCKGFEAGNSTMFSWPTLHIWQQKAYGRQSQGKTASHVSHQVETLDVRQTLCLLKAYSWPIQEEDLAVFYNVCVICYLAGLLFLWRRLAFRRKGLAIQGKNCSWIRVGLPLAML